MSWEVPPQGKAALKSSLSKFLDDMGRESAHPASQSYQVGGDHYINMSIQPWDAMRAWMSPIEFQGFLRGNAIKYIARFRSKGGVQDLRKAMHYLETLIAELERTDPKSPAPNSNPRR